MLTVESYGKADRAGSECRNNCSWGDAESAKALSVKETKYLFDEGAEAATFFFLPLLKALCTFPLSVRLTTELKNNDRADGLFFYERQNKDDKENQFIYLIALFFCVRTVSDKRMILVTFVETKVTLRSN